MTQTNSAQSTPQTTAADVLDEPASTTQAAAGLPKEPEPEVKPDKGTEKLSPKLQILLQREKLAVQKEAAARAKEAEIARREQEIEARLARMTEFETIKGKNPLKALELLGMSYEDLTKAQLSDGELPVEVKLKQLDERFNALTKDKEDAEAKEAEEAKKLAERQESEMVTKFQSEIKSYLSEHAERYELIAFEGQEDLVYEVIDLHYQRTIDETTGIGQVMKIADACDKVESKLEAKIASDKFRGLKKVQALLGVRPEMLKGIPGAPKQQTIERQKPKTLTNTMSATPSLTKPARALTDEERVRKAIAYAKGLRP